MRHPRCKISLLCSIKNKSKTHGVTRLKKIPWDAGLCVYIIQIGEIDAKGNKSSGVKLIFCPAKYVGRCNFNPGGQYAAPFGHVYVCAKAAAPTVPALGTCKFGHVCNKTRRSRIYGRVRLSSNNAHPKRQSERGRGVQKRASLIFGGSRAHRIAPDDAQNNIDDYGQYMERER